MAMRSPAGFISAFFDPLKNPDAPTSPAATAGDTLATVSFTAPANAGGSAITAYYAVSNNGITGTAASSPVTVSGLTNGTSYTFNVWALNSYGPGVWSAASNSISPVGIIAIFTGGEASGTRVNTIDYVNIATTGNATDYGDLISVRSDNTSFGSATRGFTVGCSNSIPAAMNLIEFVSMTSSGSSTDFGDLLYQTSTATSVANATRGVVAGGRNQSPTAVNTINYITMASTGNATSFGLLSAARWDMNSGCGSSTRGLFFGGRNSSDTFINIIEYITIATTGNTTDFGDLLFPISGPSSASNSVRGVTAGGVDSGANYNVIQYVTIATTGKSTDFGDLSRNTSVSAGGSNSTRAVFSLFTGSPTNAISYITIATTSNSTNFGDLTQGRVYGSACSNGHGGLQ